MTTKSLLVTGALALASFSMAYGKSFEIYFTTPVQAGNLTLEPGTYRIAQRHNNAVFTDLNTGKTYSTPATVEYTGQKNDTTTLETISQNGMSRIQTIGLGNRAIDLQLGQ